MDSPAGVHFFLFGRRRWDSKGWAVPAQPSPNRPIAGAKRQPRAPRARDARVTHAPPMTQDSLTRCPTMRMEVVRAGAKAEGSALVTGKDDNGETAGVSNAAKLLEDIPTKYATFQASWWRLICTRTPAATGRKWWSFPPKPDQLQRRRSGSANQVRLCARPSSVSGRPHRVVGPWHRPYSPGKSC